MGPGVRQGEAGAHESLEITVCWQQQWETGFAKSGSDPPEQAKAVNRTTNLFITLS